MSRAARRFAALAALTILLTGHVGSRDTTFHGAAGPYAIRVRVRAPVVIPGQAQVVVTTESPGVEQVTVQAARWDVGSAGAPLPEPARPTDFPGMFEANLWLMTPGSHAIRVHLHGEPGTGLAVVPIMAVPLERLPFSSSRALAIGALIGLLVAGATSLAAGGTRDATLPPGLLPDRGQRFRGRRAGRNTMLFLLFLLGAGGAWWWQLDRQARRSLYRPPILQALIAPGESPRLSLAVSFERDRGRARERIVPDHGKMMHLFMVREPEMDVLAHLHPDTIGRTAFNTPLPRVPPGTYRLYGDVVHADGFAETTVGRLVVPGESAEENGAFHPADPDDSCLCGGPATGMSLTMETPGQVIENREQLLRFVVAAPAGEVLDLEPYMGMAGHAIVSSHDGRVFAHLHPGGSVSMAAEEVMSEAEEVKPGPTIHQVRHPPPRQAHDTVHTLSFPWIFPKAGPYRIWVQVRRRSEVITVPFDLTVATEDAPGN